VPVNPWMARRRWNADRQSGSLIMASLRQNRLATPDPGLLRTKIELLIEY